MNEKQERTTGALVAMALLGWEVCARLTKAAAKLFVEKAQSPRPPAALSPVSLRAGQEERRRTAEKGVVLLFGAMLGWQFARPLLRRIGASLRPGSRGPKPPGGGAGATTIEGAPFSARPPKSGNQNQPAALDDCGCSQKNRSADRDLDPPDLSARDRWGLLLVLFAFAAAVAGGIGFVVTYWTGGSNQLLGGMIALCFGGLGAMSVLWAHLLTAHKQAVEPREDPSSATDHDAATETFRTGAGEIRRRILLGWMTAGGLGLVGAMVVSMFRSLGASPDTALYTTVWKRGQRLMTLDGQPVRADALAPGSTTIVFPEDSIGSEKSQTVLLRVDPALLRLPPDRSHWAPMGNLAYSRICTHAGCPVGMYESTIHQLMCPCHQSTFDVLRGAQPTGGPAARPLPQLPLYTDSDGNLRAAAGFTAPPGPGFWGMPS